MFFRKFPRLSGYSRPSSSTIRSALWENAHRSLAALGLLLATAGGALLPTSVLSCSPRLPQEGQHQKTVAPRMPTNLLHHGSQNRIQKTSRNMAARKGPRLYKVMPRSKTLVAPVARDVSTTLTTWTMTNSSRQSKRQWRPPGGAPGWPSLLAHLGR